MSGYTPFDIYRSMMALVDQEEVKVPEDFRSQALAIEQLLTSDSTGIINTMLDFAIDAALVDYLYSTENDQQTKYLNEWIENANSNLRGRVPVGLRPFAKQYFIQRWKGASLLLANVKWGTNKDGIVIPENIYMLEGRDIEIKDNSEYKSLGSEKYLMLDKNGKNGKAIKEDDKTNFYVQKPYAKWSDTYPTPFLMTRGIYYNGKLLENYVKRGSYMVNKAVSLLMLKKGSADLVKTGNPDYVYSTADLNEAKDGLRKVLQEANEEKKLALMATNFDTEVQQIIPDFEQAVKGQITAPVEKRVLSGLGLIDVGAGMGNNREQSLLNPKPFISMISEGVEDFKILLRDIGYTMVEKNRTKGNKYFQRGKNIEVINTAINEFITKDVMNQIRAMYDRGAISKQTYVELNGNGYIDFDVEVIRRTNEKPLEKDMFPPVVQNNGQFDKVPTGNVGSPKETTKNIEDEGKSPADSKNFENASKVVLEVALYKKVEDLPEQLNVLPKPAKKLWMEVFNDALIEYKSDDTARKVAWGVVKRTYKKDENTGKWKRKEKSSIELDTLNEEVAQKKLEVLEKQAKIIEQFEANNKETSV